MTISRKQISLTVTAAIIFIAATVSRIYYNLPAPQTAVTVEEQNYQVLTDSEAQDSLLVFVYPGKDTLVATAKDSMFLRRITRLRHASWVNRLWLPSCFGLAACRTDSTAEQSQTVIAPDSVPGLLRQELASLTAMQRNYCKQLSEIDYYMHSHDMQDEGFDVVIRHRERVLHKQDSVSTLISCIRRLCKAKVFRVEKKEDYTIVHNNERFIAEERRTLRKGYRVFGAKDDGMTLFIRQFHRDGFRPVYLGTADIGYGETPSKALVYPGDTVICRMQSKGQNLVAIHYKGGGYYEGEYSDSLQTRHGFGIGFDNRVRAGKWENGKFKGEQPVYSANHVYGIDISRWQHELPGKKGYRTVVKKVRKGKRWYRVKVRQNTVYPIRWDRLRVTSLGTMSKKKVNGTVDFPVSFVYIKSTESTCIKNSYYKNDYAQARKHGYKVGSYHFFSTKTGALEQAAYFMSNSRYNAGDLPPVLDLEPSDAQIRAIGGDKELLARARRWMEAVEKKWGVRPILYVSQSFINRHLSETDTTTDAGYIKTNYKIWIARYGEYKPDVHLVFWQLSPDGRVAGIKTPVDINIFNGYAPMFKKTFSKQK
ncbi:MAG: hypothetical protein NC116_04175 [Clostridium sp.]|nr:hypothetical protein [Clostridium sp.]